MASRVFVVVSSGDKEVLKWPGLRYPLNAIKLGWMDEVKVILFGPAEELAVRDAEVQEKLKGLQEVGIEVMACKVCADDWNISDKLEELGVKVVPVGSIMSQLLKDGWASLTF